MDDHSIEEERTMVAQQIATRTEVDSLSGELEALWSCFDELFAGMSRQDWARKHGKRWTFADLPYHLAYFDRECARVMADGTTIPASARWLMQSEAEVDAWNARMFAQRPAGHTVDQALAQMREGRAALRRLLGGLTDADLDRPAWSPFFGWMTRRDGLTGVIGHAFNHFMEARLRLGRAEPAAPSAVIRRSLGFYLGLMEFFIDRERAQGQTFTAVMAFTGPGGGAWTIEVDHGLCRVTEGRAERADLTMTQSPEAFVATFAKVKNPMLLMLTGKIKVKGFRGLGAFGKLFPPPSADPKRTWPVTLELAAAPA
jgi:hypothetical protein